MSPTFSEFAEWWLAEYCQRRAKYLLRNRTAVVRRYLVPLLGTYRLVDITPAALSMAQRTLMRRGLALSTIRTIFGVFAELWKVARTEGLVRGRPQSDLIWPRQRYRKPTVFSAAEQDRILAAFAERKPWYLGQVALTFLAGTRPSEAAGTRWADVDLDTGQLTIREPLVACEPTAGKTDKSLRAVRMSARLVELLRSVRPAAARADALVSVNESGRPINTERFSPLTFKPILYDLGMPYRSFYAARHTFITLALMNGASAAHVAEFCGTSIRAIEVSYLSWMGVIEEPAPAVRKRGPVAFGPQAVRVNRSHRVGL